MHELWINNNSFCSDLVAYKLMQSTNKPKMVNPELLGLTLAYDSDDHNQH